MTLSSVGLLQVDVEDLNYEVDRELVQMEVASLDKPTMSGRQPMLPIY